MWRSENKREEFLALALVLIGVLLRILPHPLNFTPVMAIALFSGVVLSPGLALSVPLLVMMASDLVIGLHSLVFLTWGAFALAVFIGLWVRKSPSASKVIFGTLAGSVLFFIITNLGVFLFQDMYPKNAEGFIQCYVMALPFFRNFLLGDLFFSALFFTVFALLKTASRKLAVQTR